MFERNHIDIFYKKNPKILLKCSKIFKKAMLNTLKILKLFDDKF